MKRLFLIIVACLLPVLAFGQANAPIAQTVRFTATNSTTGPTVDTTTGAAGVYQYVFTWSITGTVSTGAVKLQQSADSTFSSPSDCIAAQSVTSSGGPTTMTSCTAPYLRLLTSTGVTGSGAVIVRLIGYPAQPPLSASISTTGLATSANQTNSSQKTQVCDSGGNCSTVTGNKLDVNASVSLAANSSVNVNQIAGTATDVNSGVKSAGTIRVVIATDQPALTNKLLVTPDLPSGASTAAKQPALGTAGTASSDVITVQGIASMTALQVQSNSANLATVAKQPALGTAGTAASDVITVQGIASMTPLLATLSGTNNINAVTTVSTVTSLTQFNGVAISLGAGNTDTGTLRVNLATNAAATAAATPLAVRASDGTSFISDAAIGAAVTSNPVPAGCKNETSATSIANTQAGQLHCDTAQNLMVTGWLSSNGAAAGTNRLAMLPAIAYTSYANGTAYTSGRDAAATVGTDGLLWTANLPAIRPASYTASKNFAASSTTDNACIYGNATNTVLLTQIKLSGTQTTAGIQNLAVLKRSTAPSGGTSANFTSVPDYASFAAASTTPTSYTSTGPTVGTPIGDIDDNYVGLMAAATAAPDDIYVGDFRQKPIVLVGTAQGVCLNLGGAVSGGNISTVFKWMEITNITP